MKWLAIGIRNVQSIDLQISWCTISFKQEKMTICLSVCTRNVRILKKGMKCFLSFYPFIRIQILTNKTGFVVVSVVF